MTRAEFKASKALIHVPSQNWHAPHRGHTLRGFLLSTTSTPAGRAPRRPAGGWSPVRSNPTYSREVDLGSKSEEHGHQNLGIAEDLFVFFQFGRRELAATYGHFGCW